jgi:hypothetical protein
MANTRRTTTEIIGKKATIDRCGAAAAWLFSTG